MTLEKVIRYMAQEKAQEKAQAIENATSENTPTVEEELKKALEELNANATLNISEKAKSDYNNSYAKLCYGVYSLYGTYKLMFKLVKNKLKASGSGFDRQCDIKCENVTSDMLDILEKAQANGYDIMLDATSELAYTRHKLQALQEKLKSEKSEKAKNELLAQASELLAQVKTLQATSTSDIEKLKEKLKEKLEKSTSDQ